MSEKCTLSDTELKDEIKRQLYKLCETGGKSWVLREPPMGNACFDLLILELIDRFDKLEEELNDNY